MLEDTFEGMEEDDLEEAAQEEIDKVLFEVTKGESYTTHNSQRFPITVNLFIHYISQRFPITVNIFIYYNSQRFPITVNLFIYS